MTVENKMSNPTLPTKVIPFIHDGDFFFTKGVDAFYKRKFDLALKFLKKAKDIDPSEALYPSQMSIIYTEIGAYHAANQILSDVIKTHGDDYVDSYYLIANNYAHLGLLNEAQKYATLYMEKDPEGEFHSEAEQLITVLDLALEEEMDDFEDEDDLLMYQETAFYYLQQEDYLKAAAILEEALELFPDYDLFHFQSRFARFFNGEKETVLTEEESVLIAEPDQLYARFNLMFFYYALGKKDKVKDIVASFEGVYPMQQEQALKVAIGYTLAGADDEAINRFNRLHQRTVKHHVDYFTYYALALYRNGKVLEAEALFEEAKRRHNQLINKPAPWLEQDMSKSVDERK
ncbi:MAG: tetratricopeptide repeat protein [Bacillota bacterium]